MRASVHWRAYNRDVEWILSDRNQRDLVVDVADGAELIDVLRAARALGLPKGNHQTAIYEVQVDDGFWRRADSMRLCKDVEAGLTAGERAKATFTSWESIDEEVA